MIAKSAKCRGRSGKRVQLAKPTRPNPHAYLILIISTKIKILCALISLLNPRTETRAQRDLKIFDISLEFFSANCNR
uniref:Uncharacterized protein n=1 Tax=Salix viminalis TaxID=40686 RepID=A0A6N2MJ93_SALVM